MAINIIHHSSPILDRAREILGSVKTGGGLFDLHLDVLLRWKIFGLDVTRRRATGPYGQDSLNLWSHSDLVRIREAGYGGACCGFHSRRADSEESWNDYLEQAAMLDEFGRLPGYHRIRSFPDWAVARERQAIGLAPGVEGAHMLNGRNPGALNARLDRFREDGVVYVTLCHTFNSCAAPTNWEPALGIHHQVPDNPTFDLTDFGRQVVAGLADRGVAVDVAHLHPRAVLQVCELMRSRKTPVICTHTGYQGEKGLDMTMVNPATGRRRHPYDRNLPHPSTEAIVSTGGLIGVFFAPMFYGHTGSGGEFPNTSRRIAQQIQALVRLDFSWIDHVAIGTDYDGFIDLPQDQAECLDLVKVVHELLNLGFTDAMLRKILRLNALRVLEVVWQASKGELEGHLSRS